MATDLPVYFSTEEQNSPRSPNDYSKQIPPHMSMEEMRIFKECNNESFYYRCLPFAIAAMAGTYLAVQRGILKPHPKYGSTFKQIGAGIFGWVAGKVSYRKACEDKFLRLQNSTLADSIRKKRGLSINQSPSDTSMEADDVGFSKDNITPFSSPQDYHSSYGALNLDTDKNMQYSDLDNRTTLDSDYNLGSPDNEVEVRRPNVTYEELRRKNRGENTRPSSSGTSPSKWDSYSSPVRRENYKNEDYSSGAVKNTYGDTWEK